MNDSDGPFVAKCVYDELLGKEVLDLEDIPYALDTALHKLRQQGASYRRWAAFTHVGA
jgi:hypothetical protein